MQIATIANKHKGQICGKSDENSKQKKTLVEPRVISSNLYIGDCVRVSLPNSKETIYNVHD